MVYKAMFKGAHKNIYKITAESLQGKFGQTENKSKVEVTDDGIQYYPMEPATASYPRFDAGVYIYMPRHWAPTARRVAGHGSVRTGSRRTSRRLSGSRWHMRPSRSADGPLSASPTPKGGRPRSSTMMRFGRRLTRYVHVRLYPAPTSGNTRPADVCLTA